MHKTLFTIIFVALYSVIHAQPCEYVINEVDEFTGKLKIENRTKLVREFTQTANIFFGSVDTNFYIKLWYGTTLDGINVAKDDKLMLKFEDGSILTLHSMELSLSELEFIGNVSWYKTKIYYPITKEELNFMCITKLKKIRLYTIKNYMEFDIKDKFKIPIMSNAKCLLDK